MRACVITTPGGPEVLQIEERPVPKPAAGEVLVRVHAAGLNRPDILQRMGKYPPPAGVTDIPGLEIAGEVVIGTDDCPVEGRICALLSGGGYAEYAVVPIGQILPLPDYMSYEVGAALPECVFTVWHNVFVRGGLQAGESILIHGGASGIGTTAIQMARVLGAGEIFVTCGNDAKAAACEQLGATHAINYKTHDFVEQVLQYTYGCGVDVVLDMVGGDYVPRNLQCLKRNGRHVSIAVQGGTTANINIRDIMTKGLVLTGSTLRPRTPAEKRVLRDGIFVNVWSHVMAGAIKPVIHATFPLSDVASAHTALEKGDHVGKVVLRAF